MSSFRLSRLNASVFACRQQICFASPIEVTADFKVGLQSLADAVHCLVDGHSVNMPEGERFDLDERMLYLNLDIAPLRIPIENFVSAAIAARFLRAPGIYERGGGLHSWPLGGSLPTADELTALFFKRTPQQRRAAPNILSITLSSHAPAQFERPLLQEIFKIALPADPHISRAREPGFLSEYLLSVFTLTRMV